MCPIAKSQAPLLPTRSANDDIQRPLPNQGYIKPTMAPYNTIQFPSPGVLPPSGTHRPVSGDVMMRNQQPPSIRVCITELEITAGHWPFSEQTADLTKHFTKC